MDNQIKKLTAEIKAKFLEALGTKEVQEAIAETKAADNTGTFEVIISTADRDRQGDIIMQDGWVLDNYLKNPVVLFGHDYWSLPVGVCDEIKVIDGKLVAKGRFAGHAFAQEIRKLYDAGMLRTTSVGFIPLEQEGNVILKAELLEFSFVPVPANPMALSLAHEKQINLEFAFSKGILVKEETAETTEPVAEPVAETTEPIAAVAENGESDTPETPVVEEPAAEGTNDTTTPPAAAENNGDEQKPTGGDTTVEPSPQPEAEKPEGSGEGVSEPEPEPVVEPTAEEIAKEVTQKAGRTLSKETRKLLENTLANLKDSVAAIENLLEKADADSGEGKATAGKADTHTEIEPQGYEVVKDTLKAYLDNREVLRMIATAVTAGLEKHNAKIKELNGKK